MATCREVITAAARRIGLLDRNRVLNAADGARGLEILQGVYMEWVGSGMFGRVNDAVVVSSVLVEEQDRLLVNTEDSVTVTFPATVVDPVTGIERPPLDLSLAIVTDVLSTDRATLIYDAQWAAWIQLEDLSLDDEAPLSSRFKQALVASLGIRWADEYGLPVTNVLTREHALGMVALTHRYGSPRVETVPDFF